MKTLTIGFSKSSKKFGIFSWLIMWAQGTPYSHTYLKYSAAWSDRQIYFQASHSSVNFMSEERFLAEETVIKEFEFLVCDSKFNQMQDFALDTSAEPYGIATIFGLGYVIVAKKLGFKVHNPIRSASDTPVCSQLIAELLKNLDVPLLMIIDDITPKDLMPIVQNLPSDLNSTQNAS